MKPRPTPTSPKQAVEQDALERLYAERSVIEHPRTGRLVAVVWTVVIAAVSALGALTGARKLAERYPNSRYVRWFVLERQASQPAVVRETANREPDIGLVVRTRITPSLVAFVRRDAGPLVSPDAILGYGVTLTSDGTVATPLAAAEAAGASLTWDHQVVNVSAAARDPLTDVTLASVSASLTPVELGQPEAVGLGDRVWVARSDPYAGGLDLSASSVIALRTRGAITTIIESSDRLERGLTIADALDRSWVGAAVVDDEGKLIGMVAMADGTNGAYVRPLRPLVDVAPVFQKNHTLVRASLGLRYVDLANSLHASTLPSKGAYVATSAMVRGGGVEAKGAAAAVVREADIVVAINDEPLTDQYSLSEAVASHQPGDRLDLRLDRGGKTRTLNITLGTTGSP